MTFTTSGKTYAVNGTAKGSGQYAQLEDIWAVDPNLPKDAVLRKDIGPIIDRGLSLARGVDQPFVASKPAPPPAAVESGPIRCDQFEIRAALEPAGADNLRRMRASIQTDLPDYTSLIVNAGRCYRSPANGQEYSIDYFVAESTVAEWREGKVIDLDQTKWQAKVDQKRDMLRRMGETLDLTDLDSAVTLSFVVHVNQPDKRFGPRNANLVGTAVEDSNGLRVVHRESKLEWPVRAK